MRVNVQLIDAESGNHLWAERFDKPLADLFDIQDEIVARLANTASSRAHGRRGAARGANTQPGFDRSRFPGASTIQPRLRSGDAGEGAEFYERALDLDPGNVDALVGAALVDIVLSYATDDLSRFRAAAEVKLSKALTSRRTLRSPTP